MLWSWSGRKSAIASKLAPTSFVAWLDTRRRRITS